MFGVPFDGLCPPQFWIYNEGAEAKLGPGPWPVVSVARGPWLAGGSPAYPHATALCLAKYQRPGAAGAGLHLPLPRRPAPELPVGGSGPAPPPQGIPDTRLNGAHFFRDVD